jgi:hypothetical protein
MTMSFLLAVLFYAPMQSLTEIARVQQSGRDKLLSWEIGYDFALSVDPEVIECGAARGLIVAERAVLYYKGDKRGKKSEYTSLRGDEKPMHVKYHCVYANGETRRLNQGILMIQKDKSGFSDINLYTSLLLFPLNDAQIEIARESPCREMFLPSTLLGCPWSLSGAERVDGASCIVLTLNADGKKARLLLDPTRGYALVRADIEYGPPRANLHARYSQFAEAAPGMYLPKEIGVQYDYYNPKTKNIVGRGRGSLRVTKMEINNVPDSVFDLQPSKGTTIGDVDKQMVYKHVEKNEQTLEASIQSAQRNVPPPWKQYWKLYLAVNLAAALAVLLIWKWRSTRNVK